MNVENDEPKGSFEWIGSPDDALTGFEWKSSEDGAKIVIWSDVFLYEDSTSSYAILLMDTQGLGKGLSITNKANIFALNALFSSFLIYNVEFPMKPEEFENLRLSLEHAKNILEAKVNHEGGDLTAKPFQNFVFLFRDVEQQRWGFNGGSDSVDNYFKFSDKAYTESFNINANFEYVYGFSMPPPGDAVKDQNFDGRFSQLDINFQEQLQVFISEILSPHHFKPKKLFGQELTVNYFLTGVKVFSKAVKNNAISPDKLIYKTEIDARLYDLMVELKKQMNDLEKSLVDKFLSTFDMERSKVLIVLLKIFDNKSTLDQSDAMLLLHTIYAEEIIREFQNWSKEILQSTLNAEKIAVNEENIKSLDDRVIAIENSLTNLTGRFEEECQRNDDLDVLENIKLECNEAVKTSFDALNAKHENQRTIFNQRFESLQATCNENDEILGGKIDDLSDKLRSGNSESNSISEKSLDLIFIKLGTYGKSTKIFTS